MMIREETKTVRVIMKINVEGKRKSRRLENRRFNTIKNDMRAVGVYVCDIENRDKWRFRISVADPE
jgi:hypothetical protein